ncbi:uncharacterized protein LOC142547008 [Primulina tabacum]|uniref:uncharacterized protein LOC142547008 n=1 Tax=Primulina tabacum TaxID=48773 RepID=UPI003F5AB5A6
MGKAHNKRLPVVQHQQSDGTAVSTATLLCRRCWLTLFTLKCAVVLLLGVAAFLSAVLSILPIRYRHAGFDAKDSIKLAATVQAYFELHKPVSEFIPYIRRLEYDINGEIGVPYSKVVVLSMHQASVSDPTNVVFGFLFDSINNSMYPVSLSLLKSSLVDLFLQQYNLTLTSSIFGSTSSFEILKFPGGITIIPEPAAMILQIPQILFKFTLNSSIYDIKENILELKEQLRMGLQLMPNEVVLIHVTNNKGSTKDPPVTLEASVVSDIGSLQPQRLKQIARIIARSPPAENLGLNHTVFGKVKEISLSSFLKHSLHAPTPTPSPSPCPSPSPSPSPEHIPLMAPSFSPSFPPKFQHSLSPCPNCYTSSPSDAGQIFAPSPPPISNSPEPSVAPSNQRRVPTDPPGSSPTSHPSQICPDLSPSTHFEPPLAGPARHVSRSLSPLASVSHASRGLDERSENSFMSTPHVSSSFKSTSCTICKLIWWFSLTGLLAFLLMGTP